MTYSLQRYEGGTSRPLQAVPDGHRKVASMSAVHDVDLTRSGGRWATARATSTTTTSMATGWSARRSEAVFAPVPALRFHAKASRQQIAPGAEEFVPPADAQWVPPQRTFAPIGEARFSTESVQHYEFGATRQFRGLSIGVRGFRQVIDDQLVTVFGAADPARLVAAGGHYGVALAGDARLHGWAVRVEHALSPHVRGSVDYALVTTDWEAPSWQTAAPSPRWRRARCARPTSGCTI